MARSARLAQPARVLHALRRRRRAGGAARRDRSCERPARHRDHLHAVDRGVHAHRVQLRDARAPAARARLPECRRDHRAARRARHRAGRGGDALRGRPAGLRELSRPRQDAAARADHHDHGRARRHRGPGGAAVERRLPRELPVLHQQHPAARRRQPPVGPARGAHPQHPGLCPGERDRQAREDRPVRRGRARGADLRALDQDAGPEVLLADQGQAGQLRGPAGGPGSGRRRSEPLVRGEPGAGAGDHRQGGRGGDRARGGAQGARADSAQGRARRRQPARQARRLPGARSGQVRAVPGRGRFGRRLGQAGPQPRLPGDPAAARQDPQRRARPPRQDPGLERDRHADHGARHRHPRRLRSRQAALPPHHHHDRRRRRRLAHPHAAADLLLPADAGDHRGGPSLHRPAAALPGQARQHGALPQERSPDGRLSDRRRPRGRAPGDGRRARCSRASRWRRWSRWRVARPA